MTSVEQSLRVLSYFLYTVELQSNQTFLFPKELKELISFYLIDLNVWDTSITYENVIFENDNKTVIFNKQNKSVFGKKVYNISKISKSLSIDFIMNELSNSIIYIRLLPNEKGMY